MINFKNFRLYEPDEKLPNALYLRDENGLDWYECQGEFSDNTVKIVYDDKGLICSTSKTVSSLWPVNASIVEVEVVPVGFDANGKWKYIDGEITEIPPDFIASAESTRKMLMGEAYAAIAPLQDAVDLSMATDEEIALLLAWKEYRVLLSRIDVNQAPDIQWPQQPQVGV